MLPDLPHHCPLIQQNNSAVKLLPKNLLELKFMISK
jgi:hypothetical protein